MSREKILNLLQELTGHPYVELTSRGNEAIKAALLAVKSRSSGSTVLIPEEGGWLSYKTLPLRAGFEAEEVTCDEARINQGALKRKLQKASEKYAALLYQNPGGYFAEQPMQEIYALCEKEGCKVIMDVSGSIGTPSCDGKYADVLVGSFREWKLVDAGVGGFISCKDKKVFDAVQKALSPADPGLDRADLAKLLQKLEELPERIRHLEQLREIIINDLSGFAVVHPDDFGIVVVVRYADEEEKEKILAYCRANELEWTECPRYIRVNEKAVSIEVKRA